jgi:hypothetical protein
MAHIGTGNGVDEKVGRADTHDQMSYIKNNAKVSLCLQVILTDFSFISSVAQ